MRRKPGNISALMIVRSRRTLLYSLGVVMLLIYTLYLWRTPRRPLPPMPGTYQYFSEINFEYHTHSFGAISHCDPRFAPSQAPGIDETKKALFALMKTYAATMKELHAESWIAHGTLLGWHWNQKFLPWDNDIDVQMSIETLAALATAYNMSEYQYPVAGEDRPRTYLLDINPHYTIASTRDVANKIDGRWIDTTNGKYIDITAVHVSSGKTQHIPFDQGVLFSKDGHRYRDTTFEDIGVKVPRNPAKILAEEYGRRSLTKTRFHWHRFNKASRLWEAE
ncbi:hypothetical protein AYO20_00957 [Fonsecaea nubica]|uniref:LicD/FKTN/FKRP nucleotidyltransferase domain-containing protein n=1 Tax=Fonsecaea nubica TaxID=856822 RepID=A0A178DBC3_9EURO|nr:hypothetical protein AYO20_00957 [Fonsecaea nubica]OAL39560.1 hypothetical protein AYO20_00957 [Fonsecaea nubica]